MAMERINGSPLPRQNMLDGSRQNERVGQDARKDLLADVAPSGGNALTGDKAEISDAAHRLMELRLAVDRGREAMAALPDTRQEKLSEVRERLHAGFYKSPEVRSVVADGVMNVLRGLEDL